MHTRLRVVVVSPDRLLSVAAEGHCAAAVGVGKLRRQSGWVRCIGGIERSVARALTASVCLGRSRFYYGACEPAACLGEGGLLFSTDTVKCCR
jgi:hypothetical protein